MELGRIKSCKKYFKKLQHQHGLLGAYQCGRYTNPVRGAVSPYLAVLSGMGLERVQFKNSNKMYYSMPSYQNGCWLAALGILLPDYFSSIMPYKASLECKELVV